MTISDKKAKVSYLDTEHSKFVSYKLPHKENVKKVKGVLPSQDIKGKTRVPITTIKHPPSVKRSGYFSYSIQAIIRSVKKLGGRIGRLWSKEKTEHFLVTEYEDKSKKVPLAKILIAEGKRKTTVVREEKLLDEYYNRLEHTDSRKFLFRWPYERRKVKTAIPGRRELFTKSRKGRPRGYMETDDLTKVAIVPTVKKIILSGAVKSRSKGIRKEDLVTYRYWSKSNVTLILILDASTSMIPHIHTLKEAIMRLYREFRYYRDKLGIIVVQGEKAKILQPPTTNIMLIRKAIDWMVFGGKSPLADGLRKALFLIRQERRRNPHTVFLPILISDGLANVPLSQERHYEIEGYDAQLDVLELARIFRKENIPIVIINPIETKEWTSKGFLSPTLLLKKVSQITNGTYYGYKTGFFKSDFTVQTATKILKYELTNVRKIKTKQ